VQTKNKERRGDRRRGSAISRFVEEKRGGEGKGAGFRADAKGKRKLSLKTPHPFLPWIEEEKKKKKEKAKDNCYNPFQSPSGGGIEGLDRGEETLG